MCGTQDVALVEHKLLQTLTVTWTQTIYVAALRGPHWFMLTVRTITVSGNTRAGAIIKKHTH